MSAKSGRGYFKHFTIWIKFRCGRTIFYRWKLSHSLKSRAGPFAKSNMAANKGINGTQPRIPCRCFLAHDSTLGGRTTIPAKLRSFARKQRQELPALDAPIRRPLKLFSGQTNDYNLRGYKPPAILRNRPLVFCVAVFSKNFKRIIPAFSFCVLRCFQNRLQQ